MPATARILVLNGPNLNLLGEREPATYGASTLADAEQRLTVLGRELGVTVVCEQRNGEGELVDLVHGARHEVAGIVLNPGAYGHYGYALRDAVAAVAVPVIEVHITNVHAREQFRHTLVISPVARGTISGLGVLGYELALRALVAGLPAPVG